MGLEQLIVAIAVGVVALVGLIAIVRDAGRLETNARAKLRDEIKHLPDETRATIWAARDRFEADNDLH